MKVMRRKNLIMVGILALFTQLGMGQELFEMQKHLQTRWASPENPSAEKGAGGTVNHGRKGRAYVNLDAGDTLVLAQEPEGTSGTVRRIWMTIRFKNPEQLVGLRMVFYWDQADRPAVSAPLGYFFGMGLGKMIRFESALFSSPEGKSFNCYAPMPFRNGMKMMLINESGQFQRAVYYDIDYTINDKHGQDVLYFHTYYNREDSTRMREDYEILPRVRGEGRFLGVNFGVMGNMDLWSGSWWGEGEVKMYIDGDGSLPTLCGTGTEDYIGTGWGQGQYDHLYQGCHYGLRDSLKYCFYRYHIPDPVYFHSDIRVTIQQLGCCFPGNREKFRAKGLDVYAADNSREPVDYDDYNENLFERYGDDWASCAYFYLDRPVNDLPDIEDFSKRVKGLTQ